MALIIIYQSGVESSRLQMSLLGPKRTAPGSNKIPTPSPLAPKRTAPAGTSRRPTPRSATKPRSAGQRSSVTDKTRSGGNRVKRVNISTDMNCTPEGQSTKGGMQSSTPTSKEASTLFSASDVVDISAIATSHHSSMFSPQGENSKSSYKR